MKAFLVLLKGLLVIATISFDVVSSWKQLLSASSTSGTRVVEPMSRIYISTIETRWRMDPLSPTSQKAECNLPLCLQACFTPAHSGSAPSAASSSLEWTSHQFLGRSRIPRSRGLTLCLVTCTPRKFSRYEKSLSWYIHLISFLYGQYVTQKWSKSCTLCKTDRNHLHRAKVMRSLFVLKISTRFLYYLKLTFYHLLMNYFIYFIMIDNWFFYHWFYIHNQVFSMIYDWPFILFIDYLRTTIYN